MSDVQSCPLWLARGPCRLWSTGQVQPPGAAPGKAQAMLVYTSRGRVARLSSCSACQGTSHTVVQPPDAAVSCTLGLPKARGRPDMPWRQCTNVHRRAAVSSARQGRARTSRVEYALGSATGLWVGYSDTGAGYAPVQVGPDAALTLTRNQLQWGGSPDTYRQTVPNRLEACLEPHNVCGPCEGAVCRAGATLVTDTMVCQPGVTVEDELRWRHYKLTLCG